MIKTILGHLQNGVEKLESGHLSPEDMELLVEDAKELYERMVILRYKIYETNVLGVKEAVISASIRQTEIETPIDLFGSIDEPTPAPAFEVTFANGEPTDSAFNVEEITPEEDLFEEEEEQEVVADEIQEEAAIQQVAIEQETIEEETTLENLFEEVVEDQTSEQETIEEELIEVEAIEEVVKEQAAPSSWAPEFSGDQPIWMAEMEANIRDNRSVFPLESLIGAFTLNEKLQFINELFDGSSDDFSSNVKQLDQLASMDAARNMIAELAGTFSWDTESEIVEDFIYKICRRYATGA
jgi:hypothetical protein